MNTDQLLKALQGTLEPLKEVRIQLEQELRHYETQPGLTEYLLDVLMATSSVPPGVQKAAAVFFKNRVANHWLAPENKPPLALLVPENEKPAIKSKLVVAIKATHASPQLQSQLTAAVLCILTAEKWEELVTDSARLLADFNDSENVLTGLICLYEYAKNYRWLGLSSKLGSNPVMEDLTRSVFPVLEDYVRQCLAQPAATDTRDTLLRYAIKIFKFATILSLPSYLVDISNMGTWCEFHLLIIKEQGRDVTSDYDDWGGDDVRKPRQRLVKWCYGNLSRLLIRHGGGTSTTSRNDNPFAHQFLTGFVPQILAMYFEIIQQILARTRWLLPTCIHHLITFFDHLIDTPSWPLVGEQLEAVMRHLILPILEVDYRKVNLYNDSPEDYIARYFDSNDRAGERLEDVAAFGFVYHLAHKKFKLTCELMLTLMKESFLEREQDRQSREAAGRCEGALRLLAIYGPRLNSKSLPVKGQVESILQTYVCPELTPETCARFPWLTGRALDTIARIDIKFSDPSGLQQVFEGVAQCFQMNDHFAVRLMAADALCSLVTEDAVLEIVAAQLPQLMNSLMEMSKEHELDILTSVMEIFVERFAKNLEPYATQLLAQLVQKFIKIAEQLVDGLGNESELEYQAAGIVSTLLTLVVAMTSAPQVILGMEPPLRELVSFVLENAVIVFLGEAMEILESIITSTNAVTPFIWDMFQECIRSFDKYAYEYFDTFQTFFEEIITFGMVDPIMTVDSEPVQEMIEVCFTVLRGDTVDPVFADLALLLLEIIVVALKERMVGLLLPFLQQVYDVFLRLDAENAFDGYMLHHLSVLRILFAALYVDAEITMTFLHKQGFVAGFLQLWIKHGEDFHSVYGCKLQILASISLLWLPALAVLPPDFVGETVDLLLGAAQVLPAAMRARDEIYNRDLLLNKSSSGKGKDDGTDDEGDDGDDGESGFDEFEPDEAEWEAFRSTPIDNINALAVLAEMINGMQQHDGQRYRQLFGDVDESQRHFLEGLLQVQQQKQQ